MLHFVILMRKRIRGLEKQRFRANLQINKIMEHERTENKYLFLNSDSNKEKNIVKQIMGVKFSKLRLLAISSNEI